MVAERGSNAVIADVGSADYDDPRAGAFDFTRVHALAGLDAQALHLCAGAASAAR